MRQLECMRSSISQAQLTSASSFRKNSKPLRLPKWTTNMLNNKLRGLALAVQFRWCLERPGGAEPTEETLKQSFESSPQPAGAGRDEDDGKPLNCKCGSYSVARQGQICADQM